MKIIYNHPFHLVTPRPWPLLSSFRLINTLVGRIYLFNFKSYSIIIFRLTRILLCITLWWRDTIRERTFQGLHNKYIIPLLTIGIIIFIISELLFFISFFWAYFHSALSPDIQLGILWPPKNINKINPYKIPLLNTIILLYSGITITTSHYLILKNLKTKRIIYLLITILLGIFFSLIQIIEYKEIDFSINDSIYGSLFYLTTGFHGLHVIIGTIFLITSIIRIYFNHISKTHHFNFEAASWYWHFVDVIWIFVYTTIYWWNYFLYSIKNTFYFQ